ncbi:helix-turn-helix domain-containing protein [Streptomyces sp. DT2A-34]|uniref:helix-turn-helix domain-containing protein n=1 Tax=Streptomyces sp. DT2A-34 TaxID=3051182 RepID=UPI00265BDA86|nr:helix-turn-helix domain-containing protein [Streptomyces sp. DT2A-34]MDO0913114.1 helix-turn-helix domain-containing protein [Streptomyces sp. DT2A-34]
MRTQSFRGRPAGAAGATESAHPAIREDGTVRGVTAWAEALSGLYGPVNASADQGFRATVRSRELGLVRVSAVDCPAAEVRGTAGPCGTRAARYHLVLVTGGEAVLEQAGRTVRVGACGPVLLDTDRPFRLHLTRPRNTVVTAHLPWTERDGLGGSVARELPGREQLAVLVAEFLAGLARDATPYGPVGELRMGAVVTELVRALLDHRPGDGEGPATPVLLRRIQLYILDHLDDRRLTPDQVAAAHHISTRYLHRLFQGQELTVAAWIKAQRLERCRRDLADPALRHLPVHTIGARWGFAQPADFSRAFRAAYGVTPTGLRAGALPAHKQCAPRQRQLSAVPADSTS